jgi:hypothetical protein
MDRTVSPRLGKAARLLTIVVMVAAPVVMATTAHAGLGGLVKSGKDKAAQAVGQKPAQPSAQGGQAVQFDDVTLELTGDLLDKLIACRKAANEATKDRSSLVQRQEQIKSEIDALSSKNGDAITQNENKRSDVASCQKGAFDELEREKAKAEQQQIMANPQSAEKLLKLTAAMNDAQMKGDTATVNRLQKEMMARYGATHADSLAVEKKCGAIPAIHPAALRIEALQKELAANDRKIRDLDQQAMKIQVDQCHMTEKQIAMAWERIELYLARADGKSTPLGFSEAEIKALSERKDALKAALKG